MDAPQRCQLLVRPLLPARHAGPAATHRQQGEAWVVASSFSHGSFEPNVDLFMARIQRYDIAPLALTWKQISSEEQFHALYSSASLERMDNPRVESSRLSGMPDLLQDQAARRWILSVYQVFDERVVVVVVAVGKREDSAVYRKGGKRLK